ncbi:MAG: hypothetical protein WBD20_09885 [Pirellulaceae bacterium]
MSGISPLIDQSLVRSWIVCESGSRWLTASQRFITDLMPAHLTANIVTCENTDVRKLLLRKPRAVVLWEITSANATLLFERISETSLAHPTALQLAAANGLAERDLDALSELGVGAVVAQIEQLPGLSKLVHRYFCR